MSLAQIDKGLQNYYGHKNTSYLNDDGIGKFTEWAEENGYDTDSIEEELNSLDASGASVVEFDDEFPTTKIGYDRVEEIFDVLQICWKEINAFQESADLPEYPDIIWEDSEYNKNMFRRYITERKMIIPTNKCWNWSHSMTISLLEPDTPTSIFSANLNAKRTELLINGYCNKNRYFQVISFDVMKIIRLYFHHITYININKTTVKRIRDKSSSPFFQYSQAKPSKKAAVRHDIDKRLSKYKSKDIQSPSEFNKYRWTSPIINKFKGNENTSKGMGWNKDDTIDLSIHDQRTWMWNMFKLNNLRGYSIRKLPVQIQNTLELLKHTFQLTFLFDYQSNLEGIVIKWIQGFDKCCRISSIVSRIRIICVETKKEITQLVYIGHKYSVTIENHKRLGITAKNIPIRQKGIDIGIEMEVLHILYEDNRYWSKSSYSFVEDVINKSDMLYYDEWRRYFDSRCFRIDNKHFYLLAQGPFNGWKSSDNVPEFLQFIGHFCEEILSLPYDIIIIDGKQLRFSLKGRFKHGLMNALRSKRRINKHLRLYRSSWNEEVIKAKWKSHTKQQYHCKNKKRINKSQKSYINNKRKYKYNRW